MKIESKIENFGSVQFPSFSGVRAMMMPFRMEDPRGTVPYPQYLDLVSEICAKSSVKQGVGYLTIDEAVVEQGETQRRPGLHVDGYNAPYGGGGGGYAHNGMFVASSVLGCIGYRGSFDVDLDQDGGCREEDRLAFGGGSPLLWNQLYWCSPHAVHESIPMAIRTPRQFIRISMPSDAPHHREYTPNPLGVLPTGPASAARPVQMGFRS